MSSSRVIVLIREEIARRRKSRQALAEKATLRLSPMEKALDGRRPFTLATIVRLEQALGVSLRMAPVAPAAPPATNGDIAPDSLGAYSRRAVTWIEGTYVTVRPSFGDSEAVYAYRTAISCDAAASSLVFREGGRRGGAGARGGGGAGPGRAGGGGL